MLHGHHATHLKCLARSWENCFESIRCAPRTLFVGKVGLTKRNELQLNRTTFTHNQGKTEKKKPKSCKCTVGKQSKINTNNPRSTVSNMFHFCRLKCCPHLDKTATVKHSTRPTTISQDHQQHNARSKQNLPLLLLSHKSTHTRFQQANCHVTWQMSAASFVAPRCCVICLFLNPQQVHERTCRATPRAEVNEPKPRCGTSQWD